MFLFINLIIIVQDLLTHLYPKNLYIIQNFHIQINHSIKNYHNYEYYFHIIFMRQLRLYL